MSICQERPRLHSALALSEGGLPLGVLGTHLYASHFDSEDKAQNRPIEEKQSYRWRIEEWHRVLKSGCRIEAHQHQSAAKLARAIAIDTVMA